jgi:hypothetical protein
MISHEWLGVGVFERPASFRCGGLGGIELMPLQFWDVEADTYQRSMSTGRTSPVLCSCTGRLCQPGYADDGGNTTSDLFVVKICQGEMTQQKRLCEFLCGLLGQALEVPVVMPAVVRIPPGLSGAFPERLRAFIAAGCEAQFGSQFVPRGSTYPVDKVIENRLLQPAWSVFAFDMLIQNSDRQAVRPNLLTHGDALTALDHDMAFPFLLPLLEAHADPWELHQQTAREHVFYKGLRGKAVDIEPFMGRLRQLDDDALEVIARAVPDEWTSNDVERVIEHVRSVRDNADRFAFELRRTLQ